MYEDVLAVVLRSNLYQDKHKILTLFTQKKGKMTVLAKNCRTSKNSFLPACEMFACSNFQLYKRNDRYTVTQLQLKENFGDLRKDIKALLTATFLCEVCEISVMPEEEHARLFALLVSALYALKNKKPYQEVVVFFAIKFLNIMGFLPEMHRCVLCGSNDVHRINLEAGGPTCSHCPGKKVPDFYFAEIQKILKTASKYLGETSIQVDEDFFLLVLDWIIYAIDKRPNSLSLLLLSN